MADHEPTTEDEIDDKGIDPSGITVKLLGTYDPGVRAVVAEVLRPGGKVQQLLASTGHVLCRAERTESVVRGNGATISVLTFPRFVTKDPTLAVHYFAEGQFDRAIKGLIRANMLADTVVIKRIPDAAAAIQALRLSSVQKATGLITAPATTDGSQPQGGA